MNLFRSEEHARRWSEWDDEMAWALQPLQWWADTFATPMFRARARPGFMTWVTSEEGAAGMAALRERFASVQ